MKRYITYLYLYQKNEKIRNVGFIKLDVYEDKFRMEIHIRHLGRYTGKANAIMLVQREGLEGVKACDFDIIKGLADIRTESSKNSVFDSGYNMAEIIGVRLEMEEDWYIASSWKEDAASLITQDYGQKQPDNHEEITKIDLTDIKKLPRRNWYLSSNSFLLHGFLNYHYLVIKEKQEAGRKTRYLGVPGIYEEPEKMMALLFGFTEYMDGPEPPIGYWLCKIEE